MSGFIFICSFSVQTEKERKRTAENPFDGFSDFPQRPKGKYSPLETRLYDTRSFNQTFEVKNLLNGLKVGLSFGNRFVICIYLFYLPLLFYADRKRIKNDDGFFIFVLYVAFLYRQKSNAKELLKTLSTGFQTFLNDQRGYFPLWKPDCTAPEVLKTF